MKYILTDSVKHLNISSVRVKKSLFSEGELSLRIMEDLKGKPVSIISNIMTQNILEFLFTVDAARRAGAKIKRIIIPFMSYARQDELYIKGESVSGVVICIILKTLNLPIVIFDIHSLKLQRYLKFMNISLLPMLVKNIPRGDYIVVSPDFGGTKRAGEIAEILGTSLVTVKKTRKGGCLEVELNEELFKKSSLGVSNIIIVDDMISTGETLVKVVRLLKEKGAGKIYCISTHGLFVRGARSKLLKSGVEKIFVTNTFDVKSSKQIEVRRIEDIISSLK